MKVTAVFPAYNEGKTIGLLIKRAKKAKLIDEIAQGLILIELGRGSPGDGRLMSICYPAMKPAIPFLVQHLTTGSGAGLVKMVHKKPLYILAHHNLRGSRSACAKFF